MDDSVCAQGLGNDNEHFFPAFLLMIGKKKEKQQCLVSQDGTWLERGASSLITTPKPP